MSVEDFAMSVSNYFYEVHKEVPFIDLDYFMIENIFYFKKMDAGEPIFEFDTNQIDTQFWAKHVKSRENMIIYLMEIINHIGFKFPYIGHVMIRNEDNDMGGNYAFSLNKDVLVRDIGLYIAF